MSSDCVQNYQPVVILLSVLLHLIEGLADLHHLLDLTVQVH